MSLAPNRVPWWRRDIGQMLGLRRQHPPAPHGPRGYWSPLARWNSLILANTNARREAKAVLFSELAEATRQGMPLDLALTHASQTVAEAGRAKGRSGFSSGAEGRHRPLDVLVTIIMFIFGQFAYLLYLLLAFRMVDVERISRFLARRLHGPVAAGLPLSEAMRRLRLDYDDSEIRLVEAGERWGTLPAALKRLGKFQITENRLSLQGALVLYPLWLGTILALILTFCFVVILPKFRDIYDQLGAELPGPTSMLLQAATYAVTGPLGIAITFFVLSMLLMALLRGVMNGNRLTKLLLTVILLTFTWNLLRPYTTDSGAPTGPFWWFWAGVYYMILLIGNTMAGDDHRGFPGSPPSDAAIVWTSILLIPILLLLVPYLLAALERLVLRWERFIRPKLQRLPLVGSAQRAEAEARWLGALSLAISSGVPPPAALQSAGEVAGRRMQVRSNEAAQLVAGGEEIGRACVRARVLRPVTNHHLALLDGRPDYADRLHSIAEDASTTAFETIHRTGRVVEVLSIMMLGLVAGLFAIAMYMPLFNIPKIVGHENTDPAKPAYYRANHRGPGR